MNLHYFLISQDELTKILRSGKIFIPYEPREVSTYHSEDKNYLNENGVNNLKKKLLDLSINSSQDFVLSLVEISDYSTLAYRVEITIFNLKKIICLDEPSSKFFKRILPQFSFNIVSSSSPISIEKIIKKSNEDRIEKILSEEFYIKFNKNLEDKIISLEKESHIKIILGFKREINIKNIIPSYMNDLITIAMIAKNQSGSIHERYKSGENIAGTKFDELCEEYPFLKNFDEENGFLEFIKILSTIINTENTENTENTITRLNNSFKEASIKNEIIIKLIYLRINDIFKNSNQDNEFKEIQKIYLLLKDIHPEETQTAYILFFRKLNYSNIYTSYYNYKQPSSFDEFVENKLSDQEKIEKLEKQLKIKNEEIEKKNTIIKNSKKLIDSNNKLLPEIETHKYEEIPFEEMASYVNKNLIDKALRILSIKFDRKSSAQDLKNLLHSTATKMDITISNDNKALKFTSLGNSVAAPTFVAGSQTVTKTATPDDNNAEISSSSGSNSS